ncbi:MAG TPA: trypsin-like peptidase domain-containing protein [Devosia sp.]|nr:trypsin-like peptidase domain-containing protein [Devosia sp.]
MKRRPLYSRSGQPRRAGASAFGPPPFAAAPSEPARPGWIERGKAAFVQLYRDRPVASLLVTSTLIALALFALYDAVRGPTPPMSGNEFETRLEEALAERPPEPAFGSVVFQNAIGSIVRIEAYEDKPPDSSAPPTASAEPPAGSEDEDAMRAYTAIGTGVIIDDKGTILTNFHVASAGPKLRVTFMDGTQVSGAMIGATPEQDLAVIYPASMPEGVEPAVLASSLGLDPGDDIAAIGFPFGIGPSISTGVVSGTGRVFKTEHDKILTGLIQFDAAANPGNSGGPLLNADGEVVGIVTAIVNPSGNRTFAGIGFAVPIETAAAAAGENPL